LRTASLEGKLGSSLLFGADVRRGTETARAEVTEFGGSRDFFTIEVIFPRNCSCLGSNLQKVRMEAPEFHVDKPE
jgi:hypothetical protein